MRKVSVLWAEDKDPQFELLSKVLIKYLADRGIEARLTRAVDGNEVYRCLYDQQFDVLVTDLEMPHFNGLKVVKHLAANNQGLPMIAVSDHIVEEPWAEGLAALKSDGGIRGYFPVSPSDAWCEAVWRALRRAPTILHFSDIHFGDQHAFPDSNLFEALVRSVLAEVCKGGPVDIVIVTGDVCSKGLSDEFRQAERFMRMVATELALDLDRVVVVPGNHDVLRDKERSRTFTEAERNRRLQSFVDWINTFYAGHSSPRDVWRRYPKVYSESLGKLDWDPARHSREDLFCVATFDDLGLTVVGMNSVVVDERCYDDGRIGSSQLLAVESALGALGPTRESYLRICAFHHNVFGVPSITDEGLSRRILADSPLVLKRLMRQRVRLVLHGHSHYCAYWQHRHCLLDGGVEDGCPVHVFASASLGGKDHTPPQASYYHNVIRCEADDEGEISRAMARPLKLTADDLGWQPCREIGISFGG